jgi:hypothetical protein
MLEQAVPHPPSALLSATTSDLSTSCPSTRHIEHVEVVVGDHGLGRSQPQPPAKTDSRSSVTFRRVASVVYQPIARNV